MFFSFFEHFWLSKPSCLFLAESSPGSASKGAFFQKNICDYPGVRSEAQAGPTAMSIFEPQSYAPSRASSISFYL
jgi:hypothetical protein